MIKESGFLSLTIFLINLDQFLSTNIKFSSFNLKNLSEKYRAEAKRLLPDKHYIGFSLTQGNVYRKKSWSTDKFIELANKIDEMEHVEGSEWSDLIDANWKSVRDVDNEGYHVPQAHPALFDLYGQNYEDEPFVDGTSRSVGTFNLKPSKKWSVKKSI